MRRGREQTECVCVRVSFESACVRERWCVCEIVSACERVRERDFVCPCVRERDGVCEIVCVCMCV